MDKTPIHEASLGKEHEVNILLPSGAVVLKEIKVVDIDGDDLSVNQSKVQLVEDLILGDIDPNAVSLVLKKGNHEFPMNNNEKTVNYIVYFTDQYLLEIRVNQQ